MKNIWLELAMEKRGIPPNDIDYSKVMAEFINHFKIEESRKAALAIVLENEKALIDNRISGKIRQDFSLVFKECVMPIIAKAYGIAMTPDLVSVQAAKGPCDNIFYRGPGHENKVEPCITSTRNLKMVFNFDSMQDLKSVFNIDSKTVITDCLAQEFAIEWDREVLVNLKEHCKFKWNFGRKHWPRGEQYKGLVYSIWEMSRYIGDYVSNYYGEENEGKRDGNWIVMNSDLADKIFPRGEYTSPDVCPYKRGEIDGITIYCGGDSDCDFPHNEITMGYKGSILEAGYFFMPYAEIIPIRKGQLPGPQQRAWRRRGKKLIKNGAGFYGHIDFEENLNEK